jgi:UDP-glucose 4-epimerase
MESKKVLVTGGAGYIGSHTVVELFESGFEPIIVDNFSNSSRGVLDGLKKILGREVKCYRVDCCSKNEVKQVFNKEKDIFGVIHFAACKAVGESVKSPLKYYKNNILSLVNLLEIMNEKKITNLVFSSSCTVYGNPDILPVTENSSIKEASSPYGNSKQICEEIIKDTVKSEGLSRAVLLRYFNPIGAHRSALIGELPLGEPANLVPIVSQVAAGLRKNLLVFGNDYETPDGTCIRDYIHVVDLAKAHVKSLNWFLSSSEKLGIFNIGTGKGVSVLEIINQYEKISGKKIEYSFSARRQGDLPEIYADVSKANRELKWKAKFSVEDSLKSAWEWQKKLREHNF